MCSDVTVGALDCRVRLCEGETLLGIRYVICELVMVTTDRGLCQPYSDGRGGS